MLYDAFHRPSTRIAQIVSAVVWTLIVVSIGILVADLMLPSDAAVRGLLQQIDQVILLVFGVEVTLRILTYRPPPVDFYRRGLLGAVWMHVVGRLRHCFTPLILIDLLTVLGSVPFLRGLRALRLLRLLRSTFLFRYTNPFASVARAFEESRLLYVLALSLLGTSVLVGGLSFYLTENRANPDIAGLDDALWWSIVTLTTVGYGDLIPSTGLGRIVAGVLMLLGMVNLAVFAGIVGSTLMGAVLSMRMESFRMSNYVDHVIICGYEPGSRMLLDTLTDELDLDRAQVVIFAPYERPPSVGAAFHWVQGDPTKESELAKVRLLHARSVVLVGSRAMLPQQADAQTILVAFTIRRYLKKHEQEISERRRPLHIVAEILDAENEEHVRTAGANEVIPTTRMGFSLLAHAVEVPGTATLVGELADVQGNSVFVGRLPRGLHGDRSFRAVCQELKERFGVLLIGVRPAAGADLLNPSDDYELDPEDAAIYIATRPQLPAV